MSSKLWRLFSPVLSRDKGMRQPPLTSTSTNVAEFFVERVEGVRGATSNVPSPSCIAMMHLRNFCPSFHWLSVASDDAFASQKFSSRRKQWMVVGWRLETIGVRPQRTPCEKFLATPLVCNGLGDIIEQPLRCRARMWWHSWQKFL